MHVRIVNEKKGDKLKERNKDYMGGFGEMKGKGEDAIVFESKI